MNEKTITAPTAVDDNKTSIYWDDQRIEQEAELFPGDLRELYRRAKVICREQYAADMTLVTEAFAKVGATRDKTTWSRIFKKGRWNHDTEGNPLPSPIVSAKKLEEEFQAFVTQTRVELLRGKTPFAETSIWELIRLYVAKKMRPERVNKFGVITGPTGMQKSASFKELALRDPNVKHLECSENSSCNQLISMLAYKYGVSVGRNVVEKRMRVFENFGPSKCIIFDNTQDLRGHDDAEELNKFLKFCRWLQDERGGTIIFSITPQEEEQIFPKESVFMEQFEGRAGGRGSFLRLPNENPKADLVTIATSLGMKDAGKHVALLYQIGTLRGRIRTFYEVLQQAKFAADHARSPLTADYVEDALEEYRPTKEGK